MNHGFSNEQLRNRINMATLLVSDTPRQQLVALSYAPEKMEAPKVLAILPQGSWESDWISNKSVYEEDELIGELFSVSIDSDIPRHLVASTARVFSEHYRKLNLSATNVPLEDINQEHNLTSLWLLRMLVRLGGHRNFIQTHGFRNDPLAETLNLAYLEQEASFDQAKALFVLRQRYQEMETHCQEHPVSFPEVFQRNLVRLQAELNLSDVELKILAFTIFLHADSVLDDTFELIVNQTLTMQHHNPFIKEGEMCLPSHYNPAYLNASEDMAQLAQSLSTASGARVCLYGPPGTGKNENLSLL